LGLISSLPLFGTPPNYHHISDHRLARERLHHAMGPDILLDPFLGIIAIVRSGRTFRLPWPSIGKQNDAVLVIFNPGELFSHGDGHAVPVDKEACIAVPEADKASMSCFLSRNFCLTQFRNGNKGIHMPLPK
jgi:hypothetical protein